MTGKHARGFTLLEIMIVVVIVGILAAIALPAYQNQVRKGNRSAAQQFSEVLTRLGHAGQDTSGPACEPSAD